MSLPDLPADAALFLDFDGCLVEIADRPDAITVPEALPGRLVRLHRRQGGALALVSGRGVADLRRHLPGFPGAIAGSHGAELQIDGGQVMAIRPDGLDIAALHARARRLAAGLRGVLVEPKPQGVALHYRANPAQRRPVEEAARRLAGHHPGLVIQDAMMAVELRPDGAGKDRAVARLMDLPGFAGRMPVYAGDDLTDEAAMAEAQRRGGFAIRVGPGATTARYRLSGPADLAHWLDSALST